MGFQKKLLLTIIPVFLLSFIALAQTKNITGNVAGVANDPLTGVTVQVKGTNITALTGADGSFSIQVPGNGETLLFSYVGMETQEVSISGKTDFQIQLKSVSGSLNEVVVVGYGTQKKEALTGSVSTIKGQELDNRPTASPSNLLQGLAAGLTVSKSGQGGYPGSTSSIKVRNFATWQGGANQPLYVIDGFTRDQAAFDNLNPNDIASISILKDAAAASIYGMEAGNGVLLITTKSGSESRTRISYNVNYTYNKPTRLPKLMNAYEDATLQNSIYLAEGYPADNPNYFSPDELEYFKSHTYNAFEDAWKEPRSTSHNLSLSGGGKKVRYLVSGSYLHQEGGLNQKYDKYTVLAKLNGEITRGLSFSLNIDGAFTNNKRPNFPYGTDQNMSYFWYYMYYALPWKPTFINGLPVAGGTGDASNGMVFVNKNYMGNNYRIDQNNTLNTIFELKYQIPHIEGLGAKATIGLNKGYSYFKYFNAADKVYFFKVGGANNHIVTNELDSTNPGGYYALNNIVAGAYGTPQYLQTGFNQSYAYQLDLMLTYDRSFGKHNINAFGAFEPAENNGNYLDGYGKYYSNLNYQEINGASTAAEDRTATGTSNYFGQESYFGRINYNYDQKYLLSVTYRADGSMMFAPNRRWGYFPSFSLGWNISKENFFENLTPLVNFLKIRASYGVTGTDNVAAWQWQQNYNYNTSSGMLLGGAPQPSISLGTFANPDVTWERNYDYDIGFDASMPNGLVSLTADWWYRKTKDILDTRIASTPVTVGAQLPAVNYGQAAANGFEISVGHDNHIGNVHYHIGGNWAISTNKYLVKDQAATTRSYQNQIDKPIDGWVMGYVAEGIIRTQADADKILAKNGQDFTIFGYKPVPGMIMYKDTRGPLGTDTPDGKVDGNDQTPLSFNGVPRIVYGFNANISWKGIEVSTIFSGFARYDIMLPAGYTGVRAVGVYQNNLTLWKNSWSPDNTNAPLPEAAYANQGVFQPSTFWMRSGAYLRLKNLTVSYALPQKYLSKTLFTEVRAYFSGENLLLWDKINIYDPELGNALAYPMMKSFSFGLNISL